MNYVDRFENVTVLGAGGKMGSGILLLTAMEMAKLSLLPENKDRLFVLNAVDVSDRALTGVMEFLKTQVQKAAEKQAVTLRAVYKDNPRLIENEEIINQFVFDTMKIVRPTTSLEPAYSSTLIFEAILENPELKFKVLSQINIKNKRTPWFFTNTSSIPIHELDKKAGLGGRIIGFHFYNPPAVQKLVELISAKTTKQELITFALDYAKNLRKTIVHANDVAGFIGNGHFMRDGLHGIGEVERLTKSMPFVEAIYMVNRVSQDFLIRPMGIFQLIDYVGIDVCQFIMSVMNARLAGQNLHSPLLDQLNEQNVKGGQFADGSQKDGILKYEKGRPVAIYDPAKKVYQPIADFKEKCDAALGPLPATAMPWKTLMAQADKSKILAGYFKELNSQKTTGAELAIRFGKRSKEIAEQLVADGVAKSGDDVNTVLLTGFYHAYGAINEYFK